MFVWYIAYHVPWSNLLQRNWWKAWTRNISIEQRSIANNSLDRLWRLHCFQHHIHRKIGPRIESGNLLCNKCLRECPCAHINNSNNLFLYQVSVTFVWSFIFTIAHGRNKIKRSRSSIRIHSSTLQRCTSLISTQSFYFHSVHSHILSDSFFLQHASIKLNQWRFTWIQLWELLLEFLS